MLEQDRVVAAECASATREARYASHSSDGEAPPGITRVWDAAEKLRGSVVPSSRIELSFPQAMRRSHEREKALSH